MNTSIALAHEQLWFLDTLVTIHVSAVDRTTASRCSNTGRHFTTRRHCKRASGNRPAGLGRM